jgi:hypothetical protein
MLLRRRIQLLLHIEDHAQGHAAAALAQWDLSRSAQNCDGRIGPTVYRAKAVSEWIMDKGKAKTKRLFSCLQACHSVNQTDTMKMAAI